MSDSLINIIINTVKKGGGDKEALTGVKKLNAGFKELTGMSLGSVTALGAAGAAIGGLTKFLKDSVNQTVEYATEVDNLSRLLGISTEDTSRLIQASDDLFISQEKLQSGLQAATRQGIDVSIEGLKKLADEYTAMPEGIERSEWVLKNFGRSGAEMGKLMEIGAAGIDEATAAIAENMIITEQSMVDIMNYKRSVDNLNDSWQGFKYSIGTEVIPEIDFLLRRLTKGTDEIEDHALAVKRLEHEINMLSGASGWDKDGAAKRIAELQAELDKVNDEFYNSQAAAEVAELSLYGLANSVIPLSAYMSELTTQLIYNQAAAGLDAEASLELAKSLGLISPTTELAMDRIARWKEQLDSGKITIEEYNTLIMGMNTEINKLPEAKTIHIQVRGDIDRTAQNAMNYFGQGSRNPYIGLAPSNRAVGGPVYEDYPYIVGEVGPELFIPKTSGEIVPNRMIGNNITNHFYISGSGDPKAVANEVMRRLHLQGGV